MPTEARVSQSQWFSNALERENQEEYWEEIVGIDPDEMIANLIDNNNSIVNPSTKKQRQSWLEKHIQSLKLSSIPATITATGLVNELKEENFMEDEPWRKGGAGTKNRASRPFNIANCRLIW